ncbi:hypothetical protein [Symbiopectobacterium sp. RP]|uniref:hypothetical protein n=1 Tax=Symbiopectobacterium sp. RP TaxID=3248553 RepID=UPI003D29E5D4
MITANALICGKKIQLIVIKIMSLGYTMNESLYGREYSSFRSATLVPQKTKDFC